MATLRRNSKMILLCAGFMAVICFIAILARPGYARMNDVPNGMRIGPWLSQYEGKTVKITFVATPSHLETDLRRISYLKLVEAGPSGIVVTFRPRRTVFFPYSQIVSIEPDY